MSPSNEQCRRRYSRGFRVFEAAEPGGYDRKLYAWALPLAFIVIALAASFAGHRTVFKTVGTGPPPHFDLSSVRAGGGSIPDPRNPPTMLRQPPEAMHLKPYRAACNDLCAGANCRAGGRGKVTADFAWEGDRWKIATMTVAYG